jgi:outer membrane murein-binding lipoprotein Lpp
MRKLLLLIVTLSLGTFALAQPAGGDSDKSQGASNDWYNQQLSAQVQQFSRDAAAMAPTISESQSEALPASIAANAGQGAGNDWYNQVLTENVQGFDRINAARAPSAEQQQQQQ